jgi:CBS domain containing-hemolysin-like protein
MDPAHYEINGLYIIATIFLVLLNGFFVAAEFAMVRVRGSQIELKAKSGSGVAKVARGILHNLDGYLAATQLGITIASLGLGVVGEGVVTNIVIRGFLAVGITLSPGFNTAAHIVCQDYTSRFGTVTILLCCIQAANLAAQRFRQLYIEADGHHHLRGRRSAPQFRRIAIPFGTRQRKRRPGF